MQRIFLVILILFISNYSFAIDSAKCSKMLNDGWFKKYEYGGMGDYNLNAVTKATKREGSTIAYSEVVTESSTAISDPGYSTNVSSSQTQSTSSWGDCSMFAKQKMQDYQEKYIEQNYVQLLKQISIGDGEHLEMLAFFNICENKFYSSFNRILQKNYDNILKTQNGKSAVKEIKSVLKSNQNLRNGCNSEYLSG